MNDADEGASKHTPAADRLVAGEGTRSAASHYRQLLGASRVQLAGEVVRFLIVGGANTAVAYVMYLLLLPWTRYEFAYAIGYAVGIASAYVLSALFVFRQPMRKRAAATFPVVYLVQFLISLGVLKLAVDVFSIPQWLAMGVTVALTMPLTFVLSRWIVRGT